MAKKQFKAESRRLLDLMVNSIYTHKEIFLREIISNASDALDKLCYNSLSAAEGSGIDRGDLRINVTVDEEARTITVTDNGIGMTKDELDKNLGVIASSGSQRFKSEMEDGKADIDIIGQFGVGFYSAFMVSDRVTVLTRAYGSEEAYKWESEGADGYTISDADKPERGTDVIMHIKEDTEEEKYGEFLSVDRLKELVKKYSDYIRYPIIMRVGEVAAHDTTDENGDTKKSYEVEYSDRIVNTMVPIWQRARGEVSDEDYNAYFKEQYRSATDPLKVITVDAEGMVSYKALLFVPGAVPYDYYVSEEQRQGVSLYSSGVMIMEKCPELVPSYFSFVRGVVDSQDLSLNISREMLQHDRQLKLIASNLEKKIKSELLKLMKDSPEDYQKFYSAFGGQLKYGAVANFGEDIDKLKDLLMYGSSNEAGKLTTLEAYAARMPEGQPYIYYVCADSETKAAQLPQVERVLDAGYEVLYLTYEVDEFVMKVIGKYNDKELRSVNEDDLGLPDAENKDAIDEAETENRELLDFCTEKLEGKVSKVRLSRKLKSHPVCLGTEGGISLEMEKYFASMGDGSDYPRATRVLELNPEHSAFAALKRAYAEDRDTAEKYIEILYYESLLIADVSIDEPTKFADLISGLMA